MSLRAIFITCHCALFVTGTLAQLPGWTPHQVNVSICTWQQPRAALVRDTVYLDGGNIIWSQGLDSGVVDTAPPRGNFHGQIFTYNLSDKFTPDTNLTGILLRQNLVKVATGVEDEPDASDGGMLANDDGFFLYGGSLGTSEIPPAEHTVRRYLVRPGPYDSPSLPPGFRRDKLGDVSRYIAFGAAANAPSENKAWYFSGLVRPDHGPITIEASLDKAPSNVSQTLITLDMRGSSSATWSNATLPTGVKGRSNAELVWVPVGAEGILVVLGGVTYPYWVTGLESLDKEASRRESPEFMQTIDIYDVASKKWHKQSTYGGPGTRSRGCAVVAPASDASSFNIYYYGGTDGLDVSGEFYDDVWILSLPSFTWTQINQGTSLHSRAGHKCFKPYPDQMMAFGGYSVPGGSASPACLQNGPLVVFNLTNGQWMDSYDPTRHSNYRVPDQVAATIGGDGSGGASIRAPLPSGWSSSGLEDVFGQQYDEKKIATFWPYTPTTSGDVSSMPSDPDAKGKNSQDKSRIIIPVVVVPVVLLIGAGLFVAWRCRRVKKHSNTSEKRESKDSGSDEAAVRIHSWIRAQGAAKSLTTATSEAHYAASENVAKPASTAPMSPQTLASSHYEMPNSELVELENTASPAELNPDCLSPLDIIQKHSRHGRPRTDHAAESWRSIDGLSLNSRGSGPAVSSRIDSPPLSRGTTPFLGISRSDAVTGMDAGLTGPDIIERTRPTSVSPPTAEEAPGGDYLSAGQATRSLDRSAHGGHWV